MHTSYGMLLLLGWFTAPTPVTNQEPTWWRDYFAAQEQGTKDQKPLAVFVGSGQKGYFQVAREGTWTEEVKQVLARKYVCVYLDLESPSQKQLVQSLAVTKGQGLVISDKAGVIQAFHHDGILAQTDLAKQLQHFADPAVSVRTTVTNADSRNSYYQNGAPASRPSTYVPTTSFRNC